MTRHVIIDIETDSLNINTAKVKVFGAYDVEEDKYFIMQCTTQHIGQINEFLKNYDWFITFNGEEFDLPIMTRNGIIIPNVYNHIDLFIITKFKRSTMLNKDGFQSFSLKEIINTLKLDDVGKGDIDYSIFQKDNWSDEEKQKIIKYLKQDLLLTAKLWRYMNERFESFKDFISPRDVERYKHITTSSGAYAYKAICNITGLEEKYEDIIEDIEKYEGGYVSPPSCQQSRGTILCFDFASLYPWMDIQGNLFSHNCNCCKQEERWHGNNFFSVEGYYCKKQLGVTEECIKKLYMLRKEYKKNKDKREQAVKVLINSIYGLSGSPKFSSLYNVNTAGDCTSLGRQCIKYARREFINHGDEVLYSDTDSVYIKTNNKDKAILKAKEIAYYLSQQFNFPHPQQFELKLDEEIKYIQFFEKKKHYLYVTVDDNLVVKGLQVIKRDTTRLSRQIFEDMKPIIVKLLDCKFTKLFVMNMIKKYLSEDLTLATKRFNIKNFNNYKSETSIQYAILKEYGPGVHDLIRNKKIGVGKGIKYCTLDQAKSLSFDDYDLEIFLSELEPFIENETDN
jgi:DNA polymerase elongation subunit (family B)